MGVSAGAALVGEVGEDAVEEDILMRD